HRVRWARPLERPRTWSPGYPPGSRPPSQARAPPPPPLNDRPDDTAFFAPPWDSDPGGSSIVDLAGAIAGRFGARPLDAKLDPRLAAALADARQVVLLLFDGFGERQLRDLAPGGALDAARRMRLRSV